MTRASAARQRSQQGELAQSQRDHEERLNQIANRFTEKQQEIEFAKQQLNELYGPIYMLRHASFSMRELLPSKNPDGTRWRLVDHIEDVKKSDNEDSEVAVAEIIKINEAIEELLVTKAGLFEKFPPPDSFKAFTAHSRLLSLAWDRGQNEADPNRISFPDAIDDDVDNAITSIRNRLNQLRTTSQ